MSYKPEYSAKYRATHPERAKESQQRYAEANRKKIAAKNRAYRAAHPEKHREHCKKYYEANKEKVGAYHKAYALAHADATKAKYARYRANNLPKVRTKQLARYGMTHECYEAMAAAQNGCCAICLTSAVTERNGFLHVDHNHDTGKVRGLLCARCNMGIGSFEDDREMLGAAIRYLEAQDA